MSDIIKASNGRLTSLMKRIDAFLQQQHLSFDDYLIVLFGVAVAETIRNKEYVILTDNILKLASFAAQHKATYLTKLQGGAQL